MAVDLAKYLVALELQNSQYIQKLDQSNAKLERFHKQQQRAVDKIKSSFLKLGASFAAAFSVRAITNFTVEAIRAADAVGEAANAAGFGAERFQRLQFVFGQNGVEANQFGVALRTLNTRLGQFITTGAGPAAEAIERLGLAGAVSSGQIKTAEQLFDAAAGAFGNIESSAERAAIAAKLFGDEMGAKMQSTLADGIEAINEAADAATGIFTDETVRKADRLGDAWDRIAAATGNYAKSLAIASAYEIGQLLGIDELQPKNADQRLQQLLKLRESLLAQNLTLDAAEAKELADLQAQIANRAKFSTGGTMEDTIREMNRVSRALGFSEFFGGGPPDAAQLAFQRQIQSAFDAQIEAGKRLTQSMRSELEEQLDQWKEAEELFNAGAISGETLNRVRDSLLQPIEVTAERMKEAVGEMTEDATNFAQSMGENFRDAFADWIIGADRSFKDLLKRMTADMIASGIFDAFATAFSGGTSGFAKFFGSFFGGARADGGPVSAGRSYLVGERGPEIFTPRGAGMISPGGGIAIHMGDTNIDARGADSSLIQRLPKILDDHRQRTKAEIADLIRRNRFATA